MVKKYQKPDIRDMKGPLGRRSTMSIHASGREAESLHSLLMQVRELPEKELKERFKLVPHQVFDVQEVLRRL